MKQETEMWQPPDLNLKCSLLEQVWTQLGCKNFFDIDKRLLLPWLPFDAVLDSHTVQQWLCIHCDLLASLWQRDESKLTESSFAPGHSSQLKESTFFIGKKLEGNPEKGIWHHLKAILTSRNGTYRGQQGHIWLQTDTEEKKKNFKPQWTPTKQCKTNHTWPQRSGWGFRGSKKMILRWHPVHLEKATFFTASHVPSARVIQS